MSASGKPPAGKSALTHRQAVEFVLNDPVIRAEAARNPRSVAYRQHAEGVLADLAAAGFPGLESVGELYQRRLNYKSVVPLLAELLPRIRYLPLAEDIVRTLSFPFAKKSARPVFLDLFRDPPPVENPFRPAASKPAPEHLRLVIGMGSAFSLTRRSPAT